MSVGCSCHFNCSLSLCRGLLARSIITAQAASPTFTHVYAALVAIINTKFPQIGELIASRLVLSFRRAFKRNDKNACLSSVRFIAHLVNQQVGAVGRERGESGLIVVCCFDVS